MGLRTTMGLTRWTTCLLIIFMLLLFVSGCTEDQGPDTGSKDQIYTVADATGDWGFPAPYSHYMRGPGYIRMTLIFDSLIWKDDKGYTPALATSWQYNEEENYYSFNLNDGVTWHDGNKFTAKDVVFTINYNKEHPYPLVDTGIIQKIETTGDYEVKIYLEKPYAPFLDYIGAGLPILPEHIYKDIKSPEQFQEKEACIGTGPFMLMDYNKVQGTYLYEGYENYYQGKPIVSQIKYVKIGNETIGAALRQKQVNLALVTPELSEELKKEGFSIMPGAHDWVGKMLVNHQKEPLDSKEFRQALAYAIDRRALVDTCLRGYGLPGSPGLVPQDSKWYNNKLDDAYSYDPTKAENILKKLGYTKNGKYFEKNGNPLELELLFGAGNAGIVGEREGEFIKSQLEKAGIKINLRGIDAKTLDSRVSEWKFDLVLSGHGGLSSDPVMVGKLIAGGQGFSINSARYQKNKELLEALNKQVSTMDVNKRKEYLYQIQELYAEEMPALTLFYSDYYYAHDGQLNLFYTIQGIGFGTPMLENKMAFVK